jgi:hypothetical protein
MYIVLTSAKFCPNWLFMPFHAYEYKNKGIFKKLIQAKKINYEIFFESCYIIHVIQKISHFEEK